MRHEKARTDATGADVVVVGNGAPQFIEAFREDVHYDGKLVTDPKRGAYRLLEMKRPRLAAAPMTLLRAAQAFAQGHRQVRTMGDTAQLGGVVVVRPDGEMPYRRISSYAGDHPPFDEVLAAMSAAARS
ncbi:MAG: AhpC/TSA family protein [Deltaproteobacteria bacterium]|nr:AhpC/TSA family protein [Deltaproteobacteria bacterium]